MVFYSEIIENIPHLSKFENVGRFAYFLITTDGPIVSIDNL